MASEAKSEQVAVLQENLSSSLNFLEKMTKRLSAQDKEKFDAFRKNSERVVERIDQVLAEIDVFEKQFGSLIDRIASLDLDKLRTADGYNKLDQPVEKVREIRPSISLVRNHLTRIKNTIATMTMDKLPSFSLAEAAMDIETFATQVKQWPDKLTRIQARMADFERSQKL